MFVKDKFLHTSYDPSFKFGGLKLAIKKSDVKYYEHYEPNSTKIFTKYNSFLVSMPYDEVKAALTVTVA